MRVFAVSIRALFVLLLGLPSLSFAEGGLVDVPKPTAPHEVSAAVCGACHKEIYEEWKGSMHAQSTALNDPIHGAFYGKVIGDPTEEGLTKKGKYPVCLRCHAPNAAMQKKTKLDAKPAFNEGVNCVYCHTITKYKGTVKADGKLRLGQAAYENSTTHLQSPSGKNYTTDPQPENLTAVTPGFHPFPMEGKASTLFKTNEMCLGCHDRRNNFKGVPLCATGTEIEDSKSSVSCQSCHMAKTNKGHANHNMGGGHNSDMVRSAITLDLSVEPVGNQFHAKILIKNQLPHKFPTGAPFRSAFLKLTSYDADGQVLWQNFETHPIQDDPQATLIYTIGDAEGKPSSPPKATQVLSDTRMEPHSEKVLEYDVPGGGNISVIRAEVVYNLLLPKLAKKLDKVLSDDLKRELVAAMSEVRL